MKTRAITTLLLFALLAMPAGAAPSTNRTLGNALPLAPSTETFAMVQAVGEYWLLTLPARLGAIVQGVTGAARSPAPSPPPEAVPADWWAVVQEDILRSEYQVTWQEHGSVPDLGAAYQAPNRAQNLRTYFTPAGSKINPRVWPEGETAPPWTLGLSVHGYGPAGALFAFANRIEYRWKGLRESYVNETEGLVQAWVIEERQSGIRVPNLELALDTDLIPVLVAGPAVEFLDPTGTVVLRYGPFEAVDAAGRPVPVRLHLAGSRFLVSLSPRSFAPLSPAFPASLSPGLLIFLDAPITSPAAVQGFPAGLGPDPDWTAESDQVNAWFGLSAGTAGDVNGDGYSDVIVGAPYYDNGQADEGRAYAYHGSAAGLRLAPNWTAESDQANTLFGWAVASAGDVDGDGYADVVVGSHLHENVGAAFVYHGSPEGLASSANWIATGDQAGAQFGRAVSTAGDVNGDSYSDVIVGAPYYDNNSTGGWAYVYLGSASGLSTTVHWSQTSDQIYALFGYALGTAGDVDGDGYSDIVVGAEGHDTGGMIDNGRVYVYHGSADGLSSTSTWTADGDRTDTHLGRALRTAGDVNGDGYSDVIIGAPYYSNDQSHQGRAYVYHGSAGGLQSTPAWIAEGNQTGALFGWAVGTAGDVDGDGYADVIVGAHNYDNGQTDEGRVYVYLGSGSGLLGIAWMADGEVGGAYLGSAVGTAGDVNGDGYSDIIVGASGYSNGQPAEGRAAAYYGSPAGLGLGAGWMAEGNHEGAQLGLSAGTAGDVNGDGYADIIVGAPYYDSGEGDEGRAYVYLGSPGGPITTTVWRAEGDQASAHLGFAVGTAGDVNGDGYADIIVGAPGFDNPLSDEGAALVWHGSSTGLGPYGTPSNAPWRLEGEQVNAYLGRAAGTAGDVNGDGYADVIVGAYGYTNGQTAEGRATVYLGSATGLLTSTSWLAEGEQANARLGWTVGTAGDVDGDGYSDVIVGAPRYDDGESDAGRAWVYCGSVEGIGSTAIWSAAGGQSGAQFGYSVGPAGDVDSDGYADVIVGAPYYDNGQTDEGQVYLYYGSATGTLPSAGSIFESDQPGAQFGFAVAPAGDVNGDGYADVLVGAPYWSSGLADEGRALLYVGASGGLVVTSPWQAANGQAGSLFGYAVGSAGDVDGDGCADAIVGAPYYTNGQDQASEGAVYLVRGNGGDGLPLTPRQMRTDGSVQIAPLGLSDAQTALQIRLTGRMPLGREEVMLHWQAAPLSTPFGATTVVSGTSVDWTDTLTQGVVIAEQVTGLIPGVPYHWRVRLLYRPGNAFGQPAGRWVHIPWNGWTEQDFRTLGECAPPSNASFSWQPTLPAAGETATFAAVAMGTPPLAYAWDWGDGYGASGATVTHTYALTGSYPVVLTVAGPCGSRVVVAKTVYVGSCGGWQVYLPVVSRGYAAGRTVR